MTGHKSRTDVNDLTPPPRGSAPGARPAPSPADVVRASSLVEAWSRALEPEFKGELLEAAETLSAALLAERTKQTIPPPGVTLRVEATDSDPTPPHGLPRPGWFARRFTVVHVAACTVVGGAVWAGLGWIIWTAVTS